MQEPPSRPPSHVPSPRDFDEQEFDEKDLFIAARELPHEEAQHFVANARVRSESIRERVLDLLRIERVRQTLPATAIEPAGVIEPFTGNSRFEVLESLGEGGFNDVFG